MSKFVPSQVRDELYELADNYCCGSNVYRFEVVQAITEFFETKYSYIQANWYDYTFEDVGVFYVAWIEDNQLFTEAFAWRL